MQRLRRWPTIKTPWVQHFPFARSLAPALIFFSDFHPREDPIDPRGLQDVDGCRTCHGGISVLRRTQSLERNGTDQAANLAKISSPSNFRFLFSHSLILARRPTLTSVLL